MNTNTYFVLNCNCLPFMHGPLVANRKTRWSILFNREMHLLLLPTIDALNFFQCWEFRLYRINNTKSIKRLWLNLYLCIGCTLPKISRHCHTWFVKTVTATLFVEYEILVLCTCHSLDDHSKNYCLRLASHFQRN